MALIEANGININHVVDGPEGAPWVTFITGITNDTTMWDDHIPALSENFRLLRLDSRGHGGSDATPPPYSFEQLADVPMASRWMSPSASCGRDSIATMSSASGMSWASSGPMSSGSASAA